MGVRKIRPRFRMPVALEVPEVIERLRSGLRDPACPCAGSLADHHHVAELRVHERDRHFWSPALSVTVAADERAAGSTVHGVVGPNPEVWTMFALTYVALLTALTFALTLGLVQWWLGQRAWGLWVSGALVIAIGLMYGLSRLGQRLAAPQTAMLRHFLEDLLEAPAMERAVTDRDPYHERPASPR